MLEIQRQTLWRWRKLPHFEEAYHSGQQRRREERQDRMHEIMRLSLMAIERELKSAEDLKRINPFETALAVLKFVQPHRVLCDPPPVLVTPDSGA